MVLLTLCILSVGLIGCCNCSPPPSEASVSFVGKCSRKKRRKREKMAKSIIGPSFGGARRWPLRHGAVVGPYEQLALNEEDDEWRRN